jgi:hypothetical protein
MYMIKYPLKHFRTPAIQQIQAKKGRGGIRFEARRSFLSQHPFRR